jgi:hypothetical protein
VFGELSVLDPEKVSPYAVIAFTDVELHCFDADVLIGLGSRFNANTMTTLTESLNLHNPPSKWSESEMYMHLASYCILHLYCVLDLICFSCLTSRFTCTIR